MNEVSFPLAFIAGILSFVSPCVLPLLPGYVSFVTGIAPDEKPDSFAQSLVPLVLFVAGFTLVFTALGASATLFSEILKTNKVLLARIAGILIIIVGLQVTGLLKLKFLEKSNQNMLQKTNNSSSFVMGLAFAIGWTPCIGPILGGILAYASSAETMSLGSGLLLVYSLGLGIPFIIFGQSFAVAKHRFNWLRSNARTINIVGGIFLIMMGILLFFGQLEQIAIYLQRIIPTELQLGI